MTINRTVLTTAIACGLMTLSSASLAAGFQLAEYSATGLGRAYAGEAAMADNAGAQWRNPAMLTYLFGTQVSTGAIYVNPNVDVNGTVNFHNVVSHANASDYANDAVIPNFYLSHQMNERVFLGLALGTNYGMETDLSGFAASHFGDEAMIKTMEANLNLGYQLTETVSIGGGVRYVMGEGHFGARVPEKNFIGPGVSLPQGSTLKYMEGDDTSWGWQVGTTWQINPQHRVALSYKSEVVMDFEGHAEGITYGNYKPGQLSITLPATAELASFHQLSEQWAIHSSINWTDWSSFDQLTAEFNDGSSDLIKSENWKDNYRFALGTSYIWDQDLTLRAGIAYDLSAVSTKYRTATIPETSRTWLSVGAGYQATKQLTLDAGFTYIFAKKASLDEPREVSDETAASIAGTYSGKVSGNVWLLGVQASYRF
ncbi:aromatic hydrocarbon degradation protein [Vibrio sp. V27_P1S3P104]|uniref:outer membrane protein transport protein n=1 Tax=Vibrio TaxID=662 RepID=UPI000C17167D|nr:MULTISPECIES: outer membrane protein transport protein [Vibrio]NAW69489.1 aromatic hydrocarbon degradation protein [Vibrio sp. V28_P6S34P95]NAX06228.1 aromatic hydrocarbon degradation protein [Vibrio sp. V30_P3S12P165]NAX34566.1 aromatic hydrocarbon degradation protein [Vibrio sp. V29_P1S30P107]NAX36599.1 aromatic hydrocarbon degradation protein [Vibrio sp. V27_P1S3P104]NAX41558.1 aromatic hydrocarbon degradation protein [Vibrio sp. V26_P1S5P106]